MLTDCRIPVKSKGEQSRGGSREPRDGCGKVATLLLALETEGGPRAKESMWPLEAGKGEEQTPPLHPENVMQPCQQDPSWISSLHSYKITNVCHFSC